MAPPAPTTADCGLDAAFGFPHAAQHAPLAHTGNPTMPKAPTPDTTRPRTGLLLTGGGARAAYQVGVLEAIADLRLACGAGKEPNPFPIVTGTSAGAINAAALACGADQFDRTVRRIVRVWSNFHAHHVYMADSISVMRRSTSSRPMSRIATAMRDAATVESRRNGIGVAPA